MRVIVVRFYIRKYWFAFRKKLGRWMFLAGEWLMKNAYKVHPDSHVKPAIRDRHPFRSPNRHPFRRRG